MSLNLNPERGIFIGVGILTLFILAGGVWLAGSSEKKIEEKSGKPSMGQEIAIQGLAHIKEGETHAGYNSNPPTSGFMYDGVAGAGIHDKEVPDELLVHSMEHGAVIVHYKAGLPQNQIDLIKSAFESASGKKILVPRKNLDSPVALTSWGRLLALNTVDAETIKSFIETNGDRSPESSPAY